MYSPASPGVRSRPGPADHRRHLELEVEPPAPRRHRDVVAGTGQRIRVREVAERRLVPDRRDRRVRVRVLDHALDVLLEHREVADRRWTPPAPAARPRSSGSSASTRAARRSRSPPSAPSRSMVPTSAASTLTVSPVDDRRPRAAPWSTLPILMAMPFRWGPTRS